MQSSVEQGGSAGRQRGVEVDPGAEVGGEQSEGTGVEGLFDEEMSSPAFAIGIEHNNVDEWLEELDLHDVHLVRTAQFCEPRQDDKTSDVYVVAGFLDEMDILIELVCRCECLDYHGIMLSGSEEADAIRKRIKAECAKREIEVLGGRFKVK